MRKITDREKLNKLREATEELVIFLEMNSDYDNLINKEMLLDRITTCKSRIKYCDK